MVMYTLLWVSLPFCLGVPVSRPTGALSFKHLDNILPEGLCNRNFVVYNSNRCSWAATPMVILSRSSPIFNDLNINIIWQMLPASLKLEIINLMLLSVMGNCL